MFRAAVIEALRAALGADAEAIGNLEVQLEAPPRVEMGDLAFPCFPLARVRRAAPARIAADLAAAIPARGPIAKAVAEGPYVNFFADPAAQLAGLHEELASGAFWEAARCTTPRRVMIEFSQPNTHKVFHVGHLRNVSIGDALVRIFRARGHDVVAANYYGDFGIDVAKCLWWLRTHPQEAPPEEGRTAWLGRAYAAATEAVVEADQQGPEALVTVQGSIRAVLEAMEEGEPEVTALYRRTRQWCLDEFATIYAWLGVQFDCAFYESEMEEEGRRTVDEYLARGVFEESQGAIIVDLQDEKLPPALVRKRDGASLYMTWDLALARRKFDGFGVETSIYVVGAEQTLHFQQLFATLRKMGYERAADCRHVAYELVMLPEGKMSSRKGTAIPFHELRLRVRQAIEDKMRAEDRPERTPWTEAQWHATADKVAVACLKYGMLHVGNTRRVVFDIEDWTNPEGDTGAYLLYSLARIAGIQRKGGADDDLARPLPVDAGFGNDAERDLLNHLLRFPEAVVRAEETCDPSVIANHLFDGAKRFSRFYRECPVLRAEGPLRQARLVLAACTQQVLAYGLGLLGIEPVEAM